MRSIFLISGLVIGGFGGWAIAQLGDSADSSDQVLATSEVGTEPSVTSTPTESTQPATETTVEGQEDPTVTTLATDSDPETTTTTAETTPSSTTTTLATDSDPTTTTTTAEETPTTTTAAAPESEPETTTTTTETPPTTSTATTVAAASDPTPPPAATTATPAPTPPTPATTPALSTDPPSTAIQLSGCPVLWEEVRCVVARGVNHPPGEYGIEETEGSWSCTIELPELRSSESFGYMICPTVETITDSDGTRSYVPPGNRGLSGLHQVQEMVDQLDDCQEATRLVNLPISVQTDEGVTQVNRPAIEHTLHCVLRQ